MQRYAVPLHCINSVFYSRDIIPSITLTAWLIPPPLRFTLCHLPSLIRIHSSAVILVMIFLAGCGQPHHHICHGPLRRCWCDCRRWCTCRGYSWRRRARRCRSWRRCTCRSHRWCWRTCRGHCWRRRIRRTHHWRRCTRRLRLLLLVFHTHHYVTTSGLNCFSHVTRNTCHTEYNQQQNCQYLSHQYQYLFLCIFPNNNSFAIFLFCHIC